MTDNLAEKAFKSIAWAVTQSWGGKVLTFVVFIVLARMMSPYEFGVVAAGVVLLHFMNLLAEFGFGNALIQRKDLKDQDVNLPFFASIGASVALGLAALLLAPSIERLMGIDGLAPVVQAIGVLAPFNTACVFQESLYRRHLLFKKLAIRTLLSVVFAGAVAIALAYKGYGVWALVVQTYITVLFNFAWLWFRPVWRPSLALARESFGELSKFGVAVFGMRLIDFFSQRSADFFIGAIWGAAALGIYSAGARIQQTMMYLLQAVISDVALPLLSKVSDDLKRIADIYLKSTMISMAFFSPLFICSAALAPEISDFVFGDKWTNIERIIGPFLLIGAIQCVQYLNGAYYNALGRPSYALYFNSLKLAATIGILIVLYVQQADFYAYVMYFCIAQFVIAWPDFYFLCRLINISFLHFVKRFAPFLLNMGVSFYSVLIIKDLSVIEGLPMFFQISVSFVCGYLIYLLPILVISRKQIVTAYGFMRERFSKKKAGV